MALARRGVVAAALGIAVAAPIGLAAASPLLAWREPVYIVAGFAGIVAMALILVQPLLAMAALPKLAPAQSRRLHRWTGAGLIAAILIHVGGLWATSPPDVVDALTFTSPTPFSAWGVVAMWLLFGVATLAAMRRRVPLRPAVWRFAHTATALAAVLCSVAHALLIEGTMEPVSKALLCVLAVAATVMAIRDLRSWAVLGRPRAQ